MNRRTFLRWAAALPAIATATRGSRVLASPAVDDSKGFRPDLLPSAAEIWDHQVWMAKLGPKYTGNGAHARFVEFLATELQSHGVEVSRERYSFPRWEARHWSLAIAPQSGATFSAPLTSYYPYSGQTSADGVTGEIVFAGSPSKFSLDGLQGKVALVECPVNARDFAHLYQVWGLHPTSETFPRDTRPARGPVNDLTPFRNAGAIGVVLTWTDISDANAADQYTPFSRPLQNIPGVYVGRETGARLKALCGTGARATIVLDAAIIPDTATDTLVGILPGMQSGECIIVNTHTDGPNATEENGGIGIVALAKYFSKLPRQDRQRTLVFPLTTGHFAGPWVPSIRGVIEKHPDVIKKAVAAVTVEHLGCEEWMDDASMRYRHTGKHEWSVAITPSKAMADLMLNALDGSGDRAGVVNPVNGGFLGEGSALSRAGIPTIGYIPQPNYLLAGSADGCIDKLDRELMHSQIAMFARLIHQIEAVPAADLRKPEGR